MKVIGYHVEEVIMSSQSKTQIIFTATKTQLSCRPCYQHLWRSTVSLTHLSSGGLIVAIEEFFRDTDILGIVIRNPNGTLWPIPKVWEIFPCDDDNESGRRWISNLKRPDETGNRPKAMCRCFVKLQCIELLIHAKTASYARGLDAKRCSLAHFPLGW